MPADYTYKVFISYKQDSTAALFVSIYFFPELRKALREELDSTMLPSVFLDTEQIRAGDRWPTRLQSGLKQSCVLVPVLTPSYLKSDWCMSEFASFEAREAQTRKDLIVPVCYSNSQHVRERVGGSRQIFDFSRLPEIVDMNTRPGDLALLQQQLIIKVAKEVAAKINSAPPFDDWPVREAPAPPRTQTQLLGFGNAA